MMYMRERERESVCVCVCAHARVSVCVCVCVCACMHIDVFSVIANLFFDPREQHISSACVQVDNPLFNLPKQGETIRSKKDHRIVVGFDGNDTGSKATVMGRLVVSCARSAGGNASVQWVYYLKGVTP